MRELGNRNKLNMRFYMIYISAGNLFMYLGLVTTPLSYEHWIKLTVHTFFVCLVSFLSFYYPFKETNLVRALLMFAVNLYFYVLFLLYPDTTSTIGLIFLTPILSIIFFERKLFAAVISFNFLLGTGLFIGLSLSPYKGIYSSITNDIVGNLIDFWGCQVVICFIFGLMAKRMDTIKEYYLKIQYAERLNTIGQLAASVAHEIRNPLTVVKGFLQFSNDGTIPKEYQKLMIDELDRAEVIISDYLALSKPHGNDPYVTGVGIQIRSVTDLFSPYALMTNNSIQIDVMEGLWVEVPAFEIKQVLTNIIKNSLEAMDNGGEVFIKGYKLNESVIVEVKDTGVGMTEKEIKQLGTLFYSLKQKGTGIGLTVCFDIIEKYKGNLKIQSKKNVGTDIQIILPYYDISKGINT